jgi:hypothetical protein
MERKKVVPLPPDFESIEDFSISDHTIYNYHLNKTTKDAAYYRCSEFKKIKCSAVAIAHLEDEVIRIVEKKDHSHPIPEKLELQQHHKKTVKSFIKKNREKPPSAMQISFLKENPEVECPPLTTFQNMKYNVTRG